MTDVINNTEVFCLECRVPHPARQLLVQGKIIGSVDCPLTTREVVLSEQGELFLELRRQARFDPALQAPGKRPFFFHYLSITDDCDCHCPICFSAAGRAENNAYLSLEEAEELAEEAVQVGARTVIFIGGEPTLHPRLLELIRLFRKRRLKVWLATNGLRIAHDSGFAVQLKKAGLQKVDLQLDSFDPQTHMAIRGHVKIKEKLDAAHAISAAGLNLGLICTVTDHNLAELSSFCRTVFSWSIPPRTIIMQGAAQVGRLATNKTRYITREEIITSLVDGQAVPGLSETHFWPYPVFRPMDIYVHPDCSANTFAVLHGDRVEPLADYIDMNKFLDLASRMPHRKKPGTRRWHLITLAAQSLQLKALKLLLLHIAARMAGRKGVRLLFIGTGAFLRQDFLDMSRIKRCGSGNLTTSGCQALCAHYTCKPFNRT